MLVYYSIGNFINSTAETGSGIADRMLGAMATVTIEKDESGGAVKISDSGVIPLVTHIKTGQAQITMYKLSDYTQEMTAQNEIVASDPAFSLLIPNYTGLALAAVAAKHKGFTVGALNNSGVLLVGTNLDLVQSAISFTGMISAPLY